MVSARDWGDSMRRWNLRGIMLKLYLLLAIIASDGVFPRFVHGGSQLEELAIRAGFRILAQGDSSGEAQKQAAANIPIRAMTLQNRTRALQVIEKCNQFRKLPELQYSVDSSIYQYLLQHPDVAVSTWRVMGISKFEMWQTGQHEFEAQAADGSEGLADILYQDGNQCIFICDGRYHNPLLPKPLEAVALIWFRNSFLPAADGTHVVSQKADVFVSFSSIGLSAVAKVLTPVTNSLMDRNLYEVSLYASLMSRAVRDEPEWIIQVAQQMDGVLPQRSSELINIARQPRIVPATSRAISQSTREERHRLLNSGISLFDPPKPQDFNPPEALVAVPTAPALTVPQVTAKAATQPAASPSGSVKHPTGITVRTVSVAMPPELAPSSSLPSANAPQGKLLTQSTVTTTTPPTAPESSAQTQSPRRGLSGVSSSSGEEVSDETSETDLSLQPSILPPAAPR